MRAIALREEDLIRSVAEKYLRDGYAVTVQPSDADIPFHLGGFKPDLVAKKLAADIAG